MIMIPCPFSSQAESSSAATSAASTMERNASLRRHQLAPPKMPFGADVGYEADAEDTLRRRARMAPEFKVKKVAGTPNVWRPAGLQRSATFCSAGK